MKKATIQLEDLACPTCVLKIEAALKSVDGVDDSSAKVLFNASKAKVNFNEEETSIEDIENAIKNVGYEVKKSTVR